MGLLKAQWTQRTPDFSTDKNMEPQRTPPSSTDKNKHKIIEIWDSVGEPGKHGDFLVKYNPTPTIDNPEFPLFTLITESPTSSTSKNTHTETINETVQDILKTMLPKYDNSVEKLITEDDSKKDSPVPSYLSCPNDNVSEEDENNNSEKEDHSDPNEDTNQSDDTFSFDSIARHNLDT
ncbi:hypothetical protein LXL04_023514 [Taraxacum kok-saghyz]